jgi:hypothetical protein
MALDTSPKILNIVGRQLDPALGHGQQDTHRLSRDACAPDNHRDGRRDDHRPGQGAAGRHRRRRQAIQSRWPDRSGRQRRARP